MTDSYELAVRCLAVLRREEPDLSLTATMALLTLATLPNGTTMPAMDTMLDLEYGTMTRTMPQLLCRELVRRERDEHDRRIWKVRLSLRGQSLARLCAVAMGGAA